MRYEYIAIAAPNRGEKAKDAKTPADRYALALTSELNRMAAEGWEYIRADVLPSEERSGLTGRTTTYHNLLIFGRKKDARHADTSSSVDTGAEPDRPVVDEPVNAPQPKSDLPDAHATAGSTTSAHATASTKSTPPETAEKG